MTTKPRTPSQKSGSVESANDDVPDLAGLSGGAGATLRSAREAKAISLETASEALRIKKTHLAAMEQNRFQDLPAATYASGFLRAYADYLGIDRQEIMRQYNTRMRGAPGTPNLSMPEPLPEGKLPNLTTLAAAFAGIFVIFGAWQWYEHSAPAAEVSTPPAAQTAAAAPVSPGAVAATGNGQNSGAPALSSPGTAPAAASSGITMAASPESQSPSAQATMSGAANSQKSAAAAPAGHVYGTPNAASRITVHALGESWLQISDAQGQTYFSQLLKPGDSYIVPPQHGLRLTSGNASGIELIVDGTSHTGALGSQGQVLRDMPLDARH